eukprot:GGOE01036330.1.p1 GENE.GGOE01036330.1~~GGOE01036330.1.p1  ORF type:complete len:294 (-),score=72.74 GGOE01036330.1:125-952(-)
MAALGSRTLQQLAKEFAPKYQSWRSYEEQLVSAAGQGRKVPTGDWSWKATSKFPMPTDAQRDAFLNHLKRWQAGGLIEPGVYQRFRNLKAPHLTRRRNLSREEFKSLTWKNSLFLGQFLGPTGKVLPKDVTGLNDVAQQKMQKAVARAIRLGTLPPLGNPYHKYHQDRRGLTTHFAPSLSVQHYHEDLKRAKRVKRALEQALEGTRGARAPMSMAEGAAISPAVADLERKLYGAVSQLSARPRAGRAKAKPRPKPEAAQVEAAAAESSTPEVPSN